ncbi:DUF6354 family protein [Nocardia vulneris]|uniref:Uncharacterized protein n=1 Tax=Nocardia vulneris TaxID=1141657 RepID=A0ABR4ZD07_9NOCA|nr:DUF6354 family protein [Nocardia vulneris]KIA63029.1 hypothetical protein FG87_21945 [Nocardia vulneris]
MNAPVNKYGTEIRVGQTWADNDPRSAGRTLRVLSFTDDVEPRAVCSVETEPGGERAKRWRTVRIKLDRLHPTSTGYRLVEDGAA